MASEKNQLIDNYFKNTDVDYPPFQKAAKYGTGFLILGFLLMYFQYIDVLQNVNILSTVFFLIGLFSFWRWIHPYFFLKDIFYKRPDDGDIDTWFLEDMHNIIVPRALEHLKINKKSLKDENIIIVPYPIYWDYPGIETSKIIRRIGSDGLYTYSIWAVQILVVTDIFISYYSCVYDWISDAISDEKTNEYFFDDISSVRNDTGTIDNNLLGSEDQKIGETKVFKLTNMSSDYLTVITEVSSLEVPETYTNNLEKLVQALRVLLRHRRYGEEIERIKKKEEKIEDIEQEEETDTEEKIDETKENDETKEEVFFHKQLREIYSEYSKELEEQKKKYREIRKTE